MDKLLTGARSDRDAERKKLGTFGGVFTPTLLTILGVIMYLREGWVIRNAGILGGLLIIGLAFFITVCTALSMSSIATNIRIGAGGAYAIISQSLGLEGGGSLGIPLYISQALAITLYIFGFREGWLWVFPGHNAFLIDLVVFVGLWGSFQGRRKTDSAARRSGSCLPCSSRLRPALWRERTCRTT